MFRRLFLGLLILSALTSEWQFNIVEFIINPQLYENLKLDNFMDFEVPSESKRVLPECEGEKNTVFISDTNIPKYNTLPEYDLNPKCPAVIVNNYCLNLNISHSQEFEAIDADSSKSEDISLYMSDLSPPCEKI